MTIQQWQYVLSVVDTGSFSRAAENCFVTQPTLSNQIIKLENELGMMLLDRSKRPIIPTSSGEDILSRARKALTILQEIPDYIGEKQKELTGTLRLGIIPTLSQYLLPFFLGTLLDNYSNLNVEVHEKTSRSIMNGIRDMKLDCGILALPTEDHRLREIPLFSEDFLAYLPPHHPLVRKSPEDLPLGTTSKDKLGIKDLGFENMLLLAEGHCLRDQVLDVCGKINQNSGNCRRMRLGFEAGSLESLIVLVNQNLGYTLLPELVAATVPEERKKQLYQLHSPRPRRKIGLVYHSGFVRSRLLEVLCQTIKSGLPDTLHTHDK